MLWKIVLILIALWVVRVVTSYTAGGFIHILLLVAVAMLLNRVIQGRTPVA